MKRHLPLVVFLLCLVWVLSAFRTPSNPGNFDIAGFGRLPVLVNGRIKPIDSVARSHLLMFQGRQTVKTPEGTTLLPTEWLLEVMVRPDKADRLQIFEINHPELLALLKLKAEDGAGKKRFSPDQIRPGLEELTRQARLASQDENNSRTPFQKAVLQLHSNLIQYQSLRFSLIPPDTTDFLGELRHFEAIVKPGIEAARAKQAGKDYDEKAFKAVSELVNKYGFFAENSSLHPIPPSEGAKPDDWRTLGASLQDAFETAQVPPDVLAYAGLAYAWKEQSVSEFNELLQLFTERIQKAYPENMQRSRIECLFNTAQPFYLAMELYVLVFLAAVFSWLLWPETLSRTAFWLLALTFVLTTLGIFTRMWLESRPPVTNLYSSALFVGWVAVGLCLFIERLFKNGAGSMAAGFCGFCTLLIAHHLSLSGDTMEMMRAVLDSNFWLATHVVTISIGYGATYLAGILAVIYILMGVLTSKLTKEQASILERVVYGIVCFAALFSLIGTILGGIWADQSWGRFWGWDPKENGALIIVIWNAIILHARWGGIAGPRGIMALAVFGNVVTSWSWFGTNMLGVGLHSYGFNDKGLLWLTAFVVSQLLIIALSAIPEQKWRSRVLR